ncbi:MAG: carboxylesterase family protein [Cytophaga sp.]|nr:carboxylesterase family protein [Undibacterium sp.]
MSLPAIYLKKRWWLAFLLAFFLTFISPDSLTENIVHRPRVLVNGERLQGSFESEKVSQGVASFKGIPYAQAPVGALRWNAPLTPIYRPGLQQATRFRAGCFQDSYNMNWYRNVGAAFGADNKVFKDPPFSEDCLYLNVWTPSLKSNAKLPVMVWIHGGSNKAGWSFEPNYHGHRLAKTGNVVVVSIAYRLGVFGFFSHPELEHQTTQANFALQDQILALRWVQDNASHFGGDPANVTIFGESAGAADIGYLLTSPKAHGLFQRAISQSGGFQIQDNETLAESKEYGLKLAAAFPGEPGLASLRNQTSDAIFSANQRLFAERQFRPVVDGVFVTDFPADYYKKKGIAVDLLIGTNENESYMYADANEKKLEASIAAMPSDVQPLMKARVAREADNQFARDVLGTLSDFACPAYEMARAVRAGKHAWVYRFTRVRPGAGGKKLLAYHGAEIPYIFNTHDDWFSADKAEPMLTTSMMAYWSNFARNGNPQGQNLTPWPVFNASNPQVLELGTVIKAKLAPDETLCREIAPKMYPNSK